MFVLNSNRIEITAERDWCRDVVFTYSYNCRQIEKNTIELTQMVQTFNQQVAEQHEMVDTILDNTQTAKDHVDEVISNS